ncbi:MAG: NAD-dependent epimerase/dehydratase family protein [Candidatus Pelagibacterales bacterium]|nr:MAG: NAD-dependent epimerase/dehydratase family protein [Pelagibacterales bacterium]
MLLYKNRIVVTGGTGRFAKELSKVKTNYDLFFPNKNKLNILNLNSIKKFIKLKKPKYLIHLAGLSRPMDMHEKFLNKSIDLNIIGTANITKVCSDFGIKLIYFSTSYVYPGKKGNYKENDPVLPKNNYAWSKLGGESAVQMYHNSLVLRVCMTEKPFVHKKAFGDFITNFIFHEDIAKNLLKLINKKGVINVGGKIQSVFSFVKKYNPKIKKISAKKILGNKYPLNPSMNINKLKKFVK